MKNIFVDLMKPFCKEGESFSTKVKDSVFIQPIIYVQYYIFFGNPVSNWLMD